MIIIKASTCGSSAGAKPKKEESVKDRNAEMLVNVGTGSQFSVFSERCMQAEGLETRPMPGGGWLLVGASLCGGRAYALLAEFFAQTARMMGSELLQRYNRACS